MFDVVATQLALGAEVVDNRGLRIAVYRHIEQGTTDAALLDVCDTFFAAVRVALPRSIKQVQEREIMLDAVTRVCRETVAPYPPCWRPSSVRRCRCATRCSRAVTQTSER